MKILQTFLEPTDHFNYPDFCNSSKLHSQDLFDMDHTTLKKDNTCVQFLAEKSLFFPEHFLH